MSLLQREVVRGFREKKHREGSVFSVVEESVWKGVVSGFLQIKSFLEIYFIFISSIL